MCAIMPQIDERYYSAAQTENMKLLLSVIE